MRRSTTILIAGVLAALALLPAQAHAAYNVRVGLGDQQPSMFTAPAFKALKVKRVRYFLRWDAIRHPADLQAATNYIALARQARVSVLVHLSSDNLVRRKAHLPKLKVYRRDATALVRYLRARGVREFGARNEANHDSQATYKSPKRAAEEFKIVRRAAGRGSTVIALDVLDQPGVERYVARFYGALGSYRRYAKIVGIHNYSDVNRKRTSGMLSIFRAVRRFQRKATFWLTETGGIVKFGRSFPYNQKRAAARLSYLFKIVKKYRGQIGRVYVYNWTGLAKGARFDAGLTNPSGSTRPAYKVLRKEIKRYKR